MPHDRKIDRPSDTSLRDIVPVILAGGVGKRLWPLSRSSRPKPFLRFPGKQSLLQRTVERVKKMGAPVVVCGRSHRGLVIQHLQECGVSASQIILESEGRNTAPAIAAAAHLLEEEDPLLLVLPSDHMIGRPGLLMDAVRKAIPVARSGKLVMFGIKPDRAETRYGYIKRGGLLEKEIYKVDRFEEKPTQKSARDYIKDPAYNWNSGIFLFSAKTILRAMQVLCPDVYSGTFSSVCHATRFQNSVFLNEGFFRQSPSISIDYAVMEKAENTVVVPVSVVWQDLGTWPELLSYLVFNRSQA
jgi:mannose-1-phosphate guanylyltransferase/mannose-6-phosphate isomerase